MKTLLKLLGGILALLIILLLIICERDKPLRTLIPLYANQDSKFMPLMGMQVHYRDEGVAADSVPLILLHGMSSSLHTWDSVVMALKQHRRVISVDLPGFGLTGPSPENAYNFPYYSKFIDSLAARLQLKRFILAGNSMGGAISWNYALHNPKALDRMILINSAGYPKKNEKGSLGFKLASMPVINNLLLYATPKFLIRKSLESVYHDPARVTDAQVERFHDLTIREGNREAAMHIFKGSFSGDAKNPVRSNVHRLPEIKIPTLILWGDKDQLISVENAANFKRDIQGSISEIYPNIGHVPMEEAPLKVAVSILAFIK